MKAGDTVYRKAPYRVIAIGAEKNDAGDVVRTHVQLQAIEVTQYINCLDTDVETVPEAKPLEASAEAQGVPVGTTGSEVPQTS